jgi:methyl-accepting chemotaxis protein
MGNMMQLSQLVLVSEGASQQSALLDGLAAVFPSMAAAFTTSLLGVSLSSALWLVGSVNGMLGLKDEITDLLVGYLEQVVQADCRRYSLVGESMERMEQYLTDYLSQFSSRVSASVQHAIESSISRLVDQLAKHVAETSALISQVREGSEKLSTAGLVFYKASQALQETDFAEKFAISCKAFLASVATFSDASSHLFDASKTSASSSASLATAVHSVGQILSPLAGSLGESERRNAELSNQSIEATIGLANATAAIEAIQKRGMTWLSMRAKTDQQLMEINNQLNGIIEAVMRVAQQAAETRIKDFDDLSATLSGLERAVRDLSAAVGQQSSRLEDVVSGLEQMKRAGSLAQGFGEL